MSITGRVLVADGEEGVRTSLFRALLDCDLFCDCVGSGGDAIIRLGDRPYDMVILDFSLPHAGAVAVLEWLRQMPVARRPMVIAISGGNDVAPDSDTEVVQMILRKPLRIRELAAMVSACLAQVRTT